MAFQELSSWKGAAVFTAKPLIEKKIIFRGPREYECRQGEPKIFYKEMWHYGYGRIAVVTSVNLEYRDEAAKKIKSSKGYVSRWAENEEGGGVSTLIEWEKSPPATVNCIPNCQNQTFIPWDEKLAEQEASQ